MTSFRQSSLLSLGGVVENLLLSYVSSGDGGLSAILNLRQVCSTTKTWIDNLDPDSAKLIFAKSQVKLDLHELDQTQFAQGNIKKKRTYKNPFDSIRNFLANPPPTHVASLKLSGVKEFSSRSFSPEEVELWRRFAFIWWRRLESLELDYFDNFLRPKDSRVNLLISLSARSLHRLHCGKLEEQKDPLELPRGFFSIEHLSIYQLKLTAIWSKLFFKSLSKAPKLKSFKMQLLEMENIEEITNFIVSTKRKANLELTFSVTPDHCDTLHSGERRDNLTPKRLPPSFVAAVAASSASIRTLELHGQHLYGLTGFVGENIARKFFKTVVSITEIKLRDPSDDFLLQFPNLKRASLMKNSWSEAANNEVLFPPGLQDLSVELGFPKYLPPSLTYLWITECNSSVAELMKSLAALDKHCPLLKSLDLMWNGDNNFEVSCACCIDGTISNHKDSQPTTPFQNLKRLSFFVGDLPTNSGPQPSTSTKLNAAVSTKVNGAAWIFLNRFKLPQLSLLKLELDFGTVPPMLDRSVLISLIQGNIAKSLVDVQIDESFVTKNALPLKTALEVMAEENAVKRRNLMGTEMFTRWLNSST